MTKFTKSGNRKRASYLAVTESVTRAWEKIPTELVKSSFPGCGVDFARKFGTLHSRLRDMIDSHTVEIEDQHTGVSDDECDVVSDLSESEEE